MLITQRVDARTCLVPREQVDQITQLMNQSAALTSVLCTYRDYSSLPEPVLTSYLDIINSKIKHAQELLKTASGGEQ